MHFISVPSITPSGLDIPVSSQTSWALEALDVSDLGLTLQSQELTGYIRIERLDEQVQVRGQIDVKYDTPCNRCGEPMVYHHELAIEQFLAPTPHRRPDEVKADLDTPDLEFAYFDGQEFDLEEIVHEQLLLELPVQFVCRHDCRGLCPRCGANLNNETCQCNQTPREDSPWSALQKLKK